MAESDDMHSDDELNQAAKDGTIREGTATIHHKLFQRYGFLLPENPRYHGETIFFGLTAHVDASKKFIADLREEITPDQRVKFMAVPVEKDGTVKWKGLVVAPLPPDQQQTLSPSEENYDENQIWLTCRIIPNLQTHRGFATPEGADHYHDNVYFSLREASDGLGVVVTDLTEVFKPGEMIKALVVRADPRFKAKYRAIKVCKINPPPTNTDLEKRATSPKSDRVSIEEMDRTAVSWIYVVLESKGSVKLTSLAGNLSHHPEVRTVVQPQKKSVRKFLAKYPQFFTMRDDMVYLVPNCPSLRLRKKSEKTNENVDVDAFRDENWSEDDDSTSVSSEFEDNRSVPSPAPYTSHNLKSLADVSSKFTSSMLASIIKTLSQPTKMAEIFKICHQRGWEGIKSVAMLAQVICNNPNYFKQDDKGCVSLTAEGVKLSVKPIVHDVFSSKAKENAGDNMEKVSATSNLPEMKRSIQEDALQSSIGSAFSAFSLPVGDTPHLSSVYNPTITTEPYGNFAFTGLTGNRSAFIPVGGTQDGNAFQPYYASAISTHSSVDNSFPTSSVLPSPGKNYGNGYIYDSDTEDSFDEKFKALKGSHYTEEESRFLSVVARGICPYAVGGSEEVFKMLKKELDAMGITQGDADGYGSSGVLARHLLCILLDIGKAPCAKIQHFTPSGKITQTRVCLNAEKVTKKALAAMLNTVQTNVNVIRVAKSLYGINKTYHCIRMLKDDLEEENGCTVSFRSPGATDIRTSDLLEFGERRKSKFILSDINGGTTSTTACDALRKFAMEKSLRSTVIVADTEGQIFGFGHPTPGLRRMICSSLNSQQQHLKESVHHHPNYIIANAIDCEESLRLLERINARGISVYAEVAKSLERNVRKIFEVSA